MKTRLCRSEFSVNCLADIKFLYHAWDWLWTQEGGVPPHTILPYITIEDRLPGEKVSLNFQASMEMLTGSWGSWRRMALSSPPTSSCPVF
jgi:hypothetical protein